MRRAVAIGIAAAALLWCADRRSDVWKFDSITQIGGHAVTAEGHPRVIATPAGKAVEFGGVEDALFLNVHPLAGAETFTWEVIFRPDVGGAAEQRFFHFQEDGTDTRMLFEIRVIDGKWCLDSFAQSGKESKALLDREKLHTLGAWHHAAAVYDGQRISQLRGRRAGGLGGIASGAAGRGADVGGHADQPARLFQGRGAGGADDESCAGSRRVSQSAGGVDEIGRRTQVVRIIITRHDRPHRLRRRRTQLCPAQLRRARRPRHAHRDRTARVARLQGAEPSERPASTRS